jgi:type IV secretion system protein VirB10
VTWYALEPPSFRVAAGEGDGLPLGKAAPDALANAPATYGDVPSLGPPLPGDLGRPILEHRRGLEERQEGIPSGSAAAEVDRARAAAEAERQRLLATREAARASGVMVQLAAHRAAAEGTAPQAPDRVNGKSFSAQLAEAAGSQRSSDSPTKQAGGDILRELRAAPPPWTLSAGTIIPASLITGLNSDLPGMIVAQVTENVRDSASGRYVLVPQGARLIGSYENSLAFGQRRALLVWQRILFPDGSSISLNNAPATDVSGYAGIEDRVDFHTWRLLKGIALSTLLGVGTELGFGSGEGDLVRAVRESMQQNAARAGDRITARNLGLQPSLRVRPGWPVRAIIHNDLTLRPWKD